jgi:uncharacterized membrane protein YphA (DoxX/SURF4 family)
MANLKRWIFDDPPVGTGYWCSLVRALYGALLLAKLADASMPPFHMYDPQRFLATALSVVLALCLVAGLFTRTALFINSALVLASFYTSSFGFPNTLELPLVGPGSFGEPTNLYFVGVVLLFLGFTPCDNYFSLDSRRRKGAPKAEPLWGVQLILYQICAMYLWAAIGKTKGIFLSGYSLEIAWIKSGVGSLGYYHTPEGTQIFQIFSWFVVGMEFALALLLFFPRSRKAGLVLAVLFHTGAMIVFPVRDFSLALLAAFLLFLDPPEPSTK